MNRQFVSLFYLFVMVFPVLSVLNVEVRSQDRDVHSHPLVGTWRLVCDEDIDSLGHSAYPYGNPPLGFFVYDKSGNVFIQISTNPPLSRLAEDSVGTILPGASSVQLRETLEKYVAYFGTYSVDTLKHLITHHVISDIRRNYTGTDQVRPFSFSVDSLIIGDNKTWRRVLVRVTMKR